MDENVNQDYVSNTSTPMPHSATIVLFDNVAVVDPAVCKITLADIHSPDSGRNEAAEMVEMVVAQSRNVHLEFHAISPQDAAQILNIASNGRHYKLFAYDPISMRIADGEYYSSDRSFDMVQWMPERHDGKVVNLSFDCIEAKPKRVKTKYPTQTQTQQTTGEEAVG